MTAGNPLVSCIMPTYDRRAFVPLAVRWFMAQDYPERELIVVDDGPEPVEDLLPSDPRVRYIRLARREPVGIKRNIACEAARGSLIAHWDDDDWFAPQRLSAQVEVMADRHLDLCGIDRLLYYDVREGQAWRYVHPRRARPWLSLLMYRRTLWEGLKHSAARVGSDTRFVWRVDPKRIQALRRRDLNVCLIHGTNVAPKNTRGARWEAAPMADVINTLGADWAHYRDGLRAPAPAPVTRGPRWRLLVPVVEGGQGIEALLDDLARAPADLRVDVVSDGARVLSAEARATLRAQGWRHRHLPDARGRAGYVTLMGSAFTEERAPDDGALFACLPEDSVIEPNFFGEAAAAWKTAQGAGALALTVRGRAPLHAPLWTGFEPRPAGVQWHTGRIEDAFVATRALFAALDFKVPPVPGRWLRDPSRSPGVRRGLSVHLHQAGHRLLRTASDLVGRRAPPTVEAGPRAAWTVVVTTFERPHLLARLLDDLDRARSAGLELDVRVYDDASDADYGAVRERLGAANWTYVRAPRNHGKAGYWRWMSRVFADLRGVHADRMIAVLQDDVRLCERFFERAERLWRGIPDPQKVTLNVLVDESRAHSPVWTNVAPRRAGAVWKTQWVDGLYVTTRRYLELLDFTVPPVPASRWRRDPSLSSGVGQNISTRLHRAGHGMYRVDQSLVVHVDARSELNPAARAREPLATAQFVDGDQAARALGRSDTVSATLATIPSRVRQLEATVASLLPQVDRVHVFLNGYDRVPAYLDHPRIEVASSREHGDRGDAGKFFWAGRLRGFVLTCDDDIVYPDDYARRMVRALEGYRRGAVVGVHGVTLRAPVRSYYRDREVVHCERALATPKPVHLVGTGCAAYHTSALKLRPEDFESPNMADIWFGLACQRQRVPVVAIDRARGWLRIQKVESSIFDRYRRQDQQQTAAVRGIPRWRVRSPSAR